MSVRTLIFAAVLLLSVAGCATRH
ncbi:MAG: hypothetical protein JWN43_1665, partial [Gammaproteobacteria bacterium]|nr:hypothetical protein [Gammaproteobacteria bacterium]